MTTTDKLQQAAQQAAEKIKNYLQNGGFFNPEMMEHDKVRELLIECRQTLNDFTPLITELEQERDGAKSKCKETAKDFESAFRAVRLENDQLRADLAAAQADIKLYAAALWKFGVHIADLKQNPATLPCGGRCVLGSACCRAFNGDIPCTLPKGHEGPHMACGFTRHGILTWPQDEKSNIHFCESKGAK